MKENRHESEVRPGTGIGTKSISLVYFLGIFSMVQFLLPFLLFGDSFNQLSHTRWGVVSLMNSRWVGALRHATRHTSYNFLSSCVSTSVLHRRRRVPKILTSDSKLLSTILSVPWSCAFGWLSWNPPQALQLSSYYHSWVVHYAPTLYKIVPSVY